MLHDLSSRFEISKSLANYDTPMDGGTQHYPIHNAVISIGTSVVTMQSIPSRIFSDPQRQPELRPQLLQFGNGAVCEGRDALGV